VNTLARPAFPTAKDSILGVPFDVWSEPGVELGITILPPWWATIWFRTLCAITVVGILWALYLFRLRQMARRFNMTLEARVAKRTRIARDLHDTLLQSFQGVLLKIYTVRCMIRRRPEEAEKSLDVVTDQTCQAITEGRKAVQGLRSSTLADNDPACAIRMLGKEVAADHSGKRRQNELGLRCRRPGFILRSLISASSIRCGNLASSSVNTMEQEALICS
jgi:signal transduction histidine kinase